MTNVKVLKHILENDFDDDSETDKKVSEVVGDDGVNVPRFIEALVKKEQVSTRKSPLFGYDRFRADEKLPPLSEEDKKAKAELLKKHYVLNGGLQWKQGDCGLISEFSVCCFEYESAVRKFMYPPKYFSEKDVLHFLSIIYLYHLQRRGATTVIVNDVVVKDNEYE